MQSQVLPTGASLILQQVPQTRHLLLQSLDCRIALLALAVQQLNNSIHAFGELPPLACRHVTLGLNTLDGLRVVPVDEAHALLLVALQLRLRLSGLSADGIHLDVDNSELVPHQLPLHLRQLFATVFNKVNGSICQRCAEGSRPLCNGIMDLCVSCQGGSMDVEEVEGLRLHLQLRLQRALEIQDGPCALHLQCDSSAACIDQQLSPRADRYSHRSDWKCILIDRKAEIHVAICGRICRATAPLASIHVSLRR
mmetsp:Transcript_81062/g.143589  ORF Transcript_81062/g.143589 Transcript_81062/m.143589 type:complete len:253 (+) Transcript_81062:887-1645(+)